MDFIRPYTDQLLLPPPAPRKTIRIAISYFEIMTQFYEDLAFVQIPNGDDSFQARLVAMEPQAILGMALHAIEGTVANTGIGYGDIAALHRHPEVRRMLYPGLLAPSFQLLYTPSISATQQYHLDTLQRVMVDVIDHHFGDTVRTTVRGADDVILWRALMALILETARAISTSGHEKGISEGNLMSYAIENPFPYAHVEYSFILTLQGP